MVRTSNEDSYAANAKKKLFLVADGMGGHAAGEVASQMAASTMEEVVCKSDDGNRRSEEHTSELQSRFDLVCRLLLEKKKEKGRWLAHLLPRLLKATFRLLRCLF